MSQNDLDLANQSGASYRADNNAALQALASLSSGASAPSTTYAYQPWADTTNGVFKQRNGANSGWIIRGTLAESFLVAKTSAFTAGLSDLFRSFLCDGSSAAFTVTLPAAATAGDGARLAFKKTDATTNAITIDGSGAETIDGETTITLKGQNEIVIIECNGTAWYMLSGDVRGKQAIFIPANAFTATTTNGAAAGETELATNDIMAVTKDFDAATIEKVQHLVSMPPSWDYGKLTAKAVWSHPSTATNFGVVWTFSALSVGDGDALDAALGTGVDVTDTGGTTDDLYHSPESGEITPAGTPAQNDAVILEVSRKATDGSDTLAVDARLHGVLVFYTVKKANEN